MKTEFSLAQLADPDIQEADKILRKCVHCGFCTATCPTYVLLGDELDSPRGRIYLIKDMLENDRAPTQEVAKHIDRCLSCLACMTTCPSGVNYMHLVDQARVKVEEEYARPLPERLLRGVLAYVLSRPGVFRLGMIPLFLFSGAFFPIENLDRWMEVLAKVTPLWHGVDLTRMLTVDTVDAGTALVHVAYLAALAALGWFWAVRRLTKRMTG